MNVGSLTILLGANTAGLRAAGLKVRAFERGIAASSQRINRSLALVGQSFSALTIPIALVGGAAVKMFSDFEFELAKVEGLVGIARDQVAKWGKDIIALGPKVAKSPQELAEALFFVTSAGIRGAEVMEVLERSALAAAAGLGETRVVVDAVTSAMNAYGSDVLNATQATDSLVMAIRLGKVMPEEFAASIGKALPIAAQLGVSFNEVGAAMAGMTRTGTKATTSAIFLRRILASFVKTSNGAKKAMKDMGFTFSQFRETLKEEGGLITVLMRLRTLLDEFGVANVSKAFPNIRALVPILDLIGPNLEKNIELWKGMLNPIGAVDTAVGAASRTFKWQWDAAISDLNGSMISLGETIAKAIIPVINKLVGWIRNLVDRWNALDDSTRQLILRITLITAVIGPLAIVLGTLLNGLLLPLKIAFVALNLVLGNSLIMFAALGFTLIHVVKNMDSLKTATNNVLAKFSLFTKERGLEKKAEQLRKNNALWAAYLRTLGDVQEKQQLVEKQSQLGGLIAQFKQLSDIDLREEKFQEIVDVLKKMHELRKSLITDAAVLAGKSLTFDDVFFKGSQTGVSGQTEVYSKLLKRLQGANSEILRFSKSLASADVDIELFEDVKNSATEFSEFFSGVTEGMGKDLKKLFSQMKIAGKPIADFFKDFIPDFDFPSFAEEVIPEIDIPDIEVPLNVEPAAFDEINAIFKVFAIRLRNIREESQLFGNVLTNTQKTIDAYKETLAELREQPGASPFTDAQIKALGKAKDVLKGLKANLPTVGMFSSAISNMINGLSELEEKTGFTDAQIDKVKQMQKATELLTLKLNVMNIAVQGVGDIFAAFGESIGKSFAGADDAFDGLLSAFLSVFKQIAKVAIAAGVLFLLMGIPLGGALILGGTALTAAISFSEQSSSNNKVPGLANGGIIPPGFPNDTFNANLSSGEAVIPLDRLPQVAGLGQAGKADQKVVFEIKGRTLEGVLLNQANFNKSF